MRAVCSMRVSCCLWYSNFLRSGMTAEPLTVQVFTERVNKDDCLLFHVVFVLTALLHLHKWCLVVRSSSEHFLDTRSLGERFKQRRI
jgi:hypothetical protein